MSDQAVKTARAALHLMTARGLPPTPENYTSVYRAILGEMPEAEASPAKELTPEQKLDNSKALVELIRTLVTSVTEKTGDLADGLGQQSQTMQKSIDDLEHTEERQEISNLLKIIVGTAHTIQTSVEDAHREITQSRLMLEEMRAELVEAKRQVLIDPLTGARNRFGMETGIGQDIARARRADGKYSIAMLDMDYFKKVNDEYGHDAGDQALVYFSQLSRAVLRESDTLYRYGGEEFMATLPETDLHGAKFMLERLAQMLTKSPLIYQGKKIRLTFSGGVATLRENDNTEAMLARADQGLYQAKQQGRNRIITDQENV